MKKANVEVKGKMREGDSERKSTVSGEVSGFIP